MTEHEIRIGDWMFDPTVRSLRRGDVEHRIEPKMVDVLLVLVENQGRPVRRKDLEQAVWSGAAVGTDLVSRTIWKLRQALQDDSADPAYIETIPRVGYRLVAPVALESVAPDPAAVGPARPQPTRVWSGAALAIAATLVIALGIAAVWVRGRSALDPSSPLRIVPLTATPGYEAAPSLSPDGRLVAFQLYEANRQDATWDVAVLNVATGATRILSGDPHTHEYAPAWSPSGDTVAFVRSGADCEVVLRAADGGDEVSVASCPSDQWHELAWEGDGSLILASSGRGQTLGLVRIRRPSGTFERLSSPPVGFDGDRRPRPSPDGRHIAFVRQRTEGVSDIYLMDAEGHDEPGRLTYDQRRIGDLAWTPDGSAIVFSSTRGGDSRLWSISVADNEVVPVPMSGRNASRISISPDGLLAYEEYFGDSDIWALDPESGRAGPWHGSSRSEWGVSTSPDGAAAAFLSDRTGSAEVWTVAYAGAEPTRLTDLQGAQVDPPRWSPGGDSLVFAAALDGDFDVFTIGSEGGSIVPVTDDPGDERAPAWWGKGIVYSSTATGTPELWIVRGDSPNPVRITSGGASAPQPSPDGGPLYFTRPDEPGLWELRHAEAPTRVWPDLRPEDWGNWTPIHGGFLYLRVGDVIAPRLERIDLTRGTADQLLEFRGETPPQAGIGVGLDGRILFSRIVRSESDLWLARGALAR